MLITLTTDFGPGGRYVAQMKGVLYARAPGATVVDLSHDVAPQDVAGAARLLEAVAPYWPQRTVHLVVVDPGVGTDRPIVAVEALGQRFVGPDNGLFGWLNDAVDRAVAVDPLRVELAGDSSTFHGRDLMAPVAARLAQGADLHEFGKACESLAELATTAAVAVRDREGLVAGEVTEVDRYGNLITCVPESALADAPRDGRLRITLGEHETFGLWRAYGEHPPGTLVALVGSGGHAELAIVNGDAAAMLGARVGDTVRFEWEPPNRSNRHESE
ncbi:SAM-dependent chlorinase/fluorinase [Botrimarina sp.]|uniref:SAM hydrolase/SAM-dependent halogenase family protein n=1 Tax=Botrimarina sp. TaxID=2795802 RepID=UPI0032EE5BBD